MYEFTADMREISGFGGDYEKCCRKMLKAGLEWLTLNPHADPQFSTYNNIYGIINEDNEDAKALSKVIAGDFNPSGAMMQAVCSSVIWIKNNGWGAYVENMSHPLGRIGILEDKITKLEERNELYLQRLDEIRAECDRRGEIIARYVFGWRKYHVSGNDEQMAYGPSAEAVYEITIGGKLTELIDDEIERVRTV